MRVPLCLLLIFIIISPPVSLTDRYSEFRYLRDSAAVSVLAAHHLAFHAMCQAVFYILCFRADAIAQSPVRRVRLALT